MSGNDDHPPHDLQLDAESVEPPSPIYTCEPSLRLFVR